MRKKQTTKSSTRAKSRRKYPTEYLAVALSLVLFVEGMAIGSTKLTDWNQAFEVMDVSSAVSTTITDMQAVFTPVTDLVSSVNIFYAMATDEMTALLDFSNQPSEVADIYNGVSAFYSQATTHMASLLDASGSGEVSGIWISK